MATEASVAPADEGSGDLQEFGYQQELKRRLGGFQMFAISFAFISVAVGIFGTYGQVLQSGGPFGIWIWVAAAEPVKPGETTCYADLLSASGLGSLIQATVGSFGGWGRRCPNRAGLAA